MKKKTQARVISSKTIYKGRIFNVVVDRVREPSGVLVKREIVRHPGCEIRSLPGPTPADRPSVSRQPRDSDLRFHSGPPQAERPGAKECSVFWG